MQGAEKNVSGTQPYEVSNEGPRLDVVMVSGPEDRTVALTVISPNEKAIRNINVINVLHTIANMETIYPPIRERYMQQRVMNQIFNKAIKIRVILETLPILLLKLYKLTWHHTTLYI